MDVKEGNRRIKERNRDMRGKREGGKMRGYIIELLQKIAKK